MSAKTGAPPRSVAVIGAGPAGLTLALALNQLGIRSKVFELRPPEYSRGGSVAITPNGLRIFDQLDVFDRVRTKGCYLARMAFKSDDGFQNTGAQVFGEENESGYKALIISRSILMAELRAVSYDRGVSIEYNRQFREVLSEGQDGVHFAFEDGGHETADILVGADGINSLVRHHVLPDVKPLYSGFIGGTFGVDWEQLRFPPGQEENSPTPLTIHGSRGAIVLVPRPFAHTNALGVRQIKYQEQDREGWETLQLNRDELVGLLQADMDEWSDVSRSVLEQLNFPETADLNYWPFYQMPKMPTWSSESGRVVFLGDAAHAMLTSAAQGANQAIESAYTLAVVLDALPSFQALPAALRVWQEYRQNRIDKVLHIIDLLNYLRLPDSEKNKLPLAKKEQFQNAHIQIASIIGPIYSADVKEEVLDELSRVEEAVKDDWI